MLPSLLNLLRDHARSTEDRNHVLVIGPAAVVSPERVAAARGEHGVQLASADLDRSELRDEADLVVETVNPVDVVPMGRVQH